MSELILKLLYALDTAQTNEEVIQVSKRIAEIGESAIPELLQYAKQLYPRPSGLASVMRILKLMGYPANRSAFPFIVSQASNINSSGWETALNTLIEIGEPALPELRNALQFYTQDLDEYQNEVQGLAILLKLMGSPLIDPLLPDLLLILEAGTDENHVDEYILLPLGEIGSPKADDALNYLHTIIASSRSKQIRKASIDSLSKFEHSKIRSFIPVLRDCLYDDDEVIRTSAVKILNYLGEI